MKINVTHIVDQLEDVRGSITRIVDDKKLTLRTILRIKSRAGSIRSNHYHIKDYHYMYLESGKCEYSEKPADKPNAKIETVTLVPGDLVLTKHGIIHAVKFLKDSILYAFSTEGRSQKEYKKDTKRIIIIR